MQDERWLASVLLTTAGLFVSRMALTTRSTPRMLAKGIVGMAAGHILVLHSQNGLWKPQENMLLWLWVATLLYGACSVLIERPMSIIANASTSLTCGFLCAIGDACQVFVLYEVLSRPAGFSYVALTAFAQLLLSTTTLWCADSYKWYFAITVPVTALYIHLRDIATETVGALTAQHLGMVSFPILVFGGVLVARLSISHFLDIDAQFARLMNKTFEAFIAVDDQDVVRYWNAPATRIFEWEEHEAVGSVVSQLIIPQEYRVAHSIGMARYMKSGVAPMFGRFIEVPAVTKSGKRLLIEMSVTAIHVGAKVRFVAFLRDVTHKRKETEDLARARDEAIRIAETKTQFLANVSHETRTPLQGLLGLAQLLLDDQTLKPHQRESVLLIERSAHVLLDLINDLLDLTKAEAGKMHIKKSEFHIMNLIDDCTCLLSDVARAKGLQYVATVARSVFDRGPVLGDVRKLSSILTNILGNAVKYTDQGSVRLHAFLSPERPKPLDNNYITVRFEFKDTGIGMAPDVADKIFLPFYQADQSATRKRGGTGLGLAITKKLVELMGGTIAVQSNLGEGTKFTVDLPFELATTSSSELKDNPSPSVEETDTSIGVFGNDAFTICAITEYASALGKKLVLFNTAADLPPTDAKSVRLLFVLEAALDTQKSRDMLAEWYAACSKPPTLALLRDRKCLGCSTVSERQLVFIKQVWLPLKQTHFVGIVRAVEQGLPFTTSSEDDMLSPSPSSNPSLSAYRSAMPAAAQYSTLVYPRTQGSRPEVPVAKVLVAEDNPISQRVLSMLIVKEGFAVDIAGTGREAYDLLQTKHAEYSIILMDLQMPEMDGLAATALIREWEDQHALHHIPILAVTACAMQEDRERCLAAGMADYVTKPINRDTLRELFQKYIVRGSR